MSQKHYNQKYNKISRKWSADIFRVIKSSRSIWRMKIANETKTLNTTSSICCRFSAPLFLQSSVTRGLAVSSFAQNAELNDRQWTPISSSFPSKTTTITRKVNFITKHWDGRTDRQTNHMPAAGLACLPANENNRQSVVEKWSQETVFWLFYKQRETNTARKGKYKRKTQINTNKCTQTYLYIKIYMCVCMWWIPLQVCVWYSNAPSQKLELI